MSGDVAYAPAGAMSEGTQVSSPQVFSTLVRREFWEHRSFWMVPLILASLVVVCTVASMISAWVQHGPELREAASQLDALSGPEVSSLWSAAILGMAVPFNLAFAFVAVFYLLDALHSERKDRSVLFWKSLPVSDTQTVLSKFFTAMVALPVLFLAAALASLVIVAIFVSIGLPFLGASPFALLVSPVPIAKSLVMLLYGILAQSLWYAPVAAWLLLASSFARGWPMMWALLPPLGLILIESLVLRTEVIASAIGEYFARFRHAFEPGKDGWGEMTISMGHSDGLTVDGQGVQDGLLTLANPAGLFGSPVLWIGLGVTAVLLAAAIYMRRYRESH